MARKICAKYAEPVKTSGLVLLDAEFREGPLLVNDLQDTIEETILLQDRANVSEKIVDILGTNDNVSVEAIQLAEINLSSLRRKLNYQRSNISVESVRNLQIALEEEKGFLARIWDMIKAVFKWIGEKISQFVNWIKGLFGGGKPKKAEEAIQKAADAKISLDVNPPAAGTPHDPTRDVAKTTMVVSSDEIDKLTEEVMKVVDEKFTTEKTNTITVPLAGENVTITKPSAKSSLEKAIRKTASFEASAGSVDSLRILAEHKEDYIKHIKALDVKKLSLFKDDFLHYLKLVETVFKTINVDKVANHIQTEKVDSNEMRDYAGSLFSEVIMPERVAACFKNSTVNSNYYSCTLQLHEENLTFQIGLTKITKVLLNGLGPIESFVRPLEKNKTGTFKVKDSDIKFLAKEADTINNKVAKDTKDLDSGLDIVDFIKKIEAEEGALELRMQQFSNSIPTSSIKLTADFMLLKVCLSAYIKSITRFISELANWWKSTLVSISLDYNRIVEFVLETAQALHKAERRNEDTVEWLTKLCGSSS